MDILIADHRRKRYYPHAPLPELKPPLTAKDTEAWVVKHFPKLAGLATKPEEPYKPTPKRDRCKEGEYLWVYPWRLLAMFGWAIRWIFFYRKEDWEPTEPEELPTITGRQAYNEYVKAERIRLGLPPVKRYKRRKHRS